MNTGVTAKRLSTGFVSLACLVALITLIGLGVWQTQRLFWKNNLIAQITNRARLEPASLDKVLGMASDGQDIRFRRVGLSGSYQHKSELHFYTIHEGEPGWRVVTPFTTVNQSVVLIDRGFVPIPSKEQTSRQNGVIAGAVEVVGAVRTEYAPKGSFTPNNIPARNRWYWMDRLAALKAANIPDAVPFVIQLEAADHAGRWPKALKVSPRLSNNHLSYALTWFGMALGLAVVFVVAIVNSRQVESER